MVGEAENYDFVPLIRDERKEEEEGKRQETIETKAHRGNEQSLTETALMIPYSVSQFHIKTTSTQKQSRSPELQKKL